MTMIIIAIIVISPTIITMMITIIYQQLVNNHSLYVALLEN